MTKIQKLKTMYPSEADYIELLSKYIPNKNTSYLRFLMKDINQLKTLNLTEIINICDKFKIFDKFKNVLTYRKIERYKNLEMFLNDVNSIYNMDIENDGIILYQSETMEIIKHINKSSIYKVAISIHPLVKKAVLNKDGNIVGRAKWCVANQLNSYMLIRYCTDIPLGINKDVIEDLLDDDQTKYIFGGYDLYTIKVKEGEFFRIYALLDKWVMNGLIELRDENNDLYSSNPLYDFAKEYPEIFKTKLGNFFNTVLYEDAKSKVTENIKNNLNVNFVSDIISSSINTIDKSICKLVIKLCEQNNVRITMQDSILLKIMKINIPFNIVPIVTTHSNVLNV